MNNQNENKTGNKILTPKKGIAIFGILALAVLVMSVGGNEDTTQDTLGEEAVIENTPVLNPSAPLLGNQEQEQGGNNEEENNNNNQGGNNEEEGNNNQGGNNEGENNENTNVNPPPSGNENTNTIPPAGGNENTNTNTPPAGGNTGTNTPPAGNENTGNNSANQTNPGNTPPSGAAGSGAGQQQQSEDDGANNNEEEEEEPLSNVLGIPSNLSGEATSSSSITMQWDEVQDAIYYDLAYCGGDVSCSGNMDAIRQIQDTTYTVSDLEANTKYTFSVIAKNDTQISTDWSSNVTVKTKAVKAKRSSGGGGSGSDDSDNTQSVSPGQYPTPTVSAYLTVDTNTEYYDGDANNVATNIIPYDSYLIINSNVPATVSNPNDDPNDPNDDEVANPNNPVRYDISVCFREVTSSSWECKDYATNVATLGTDPNSNDYSLRYEIYDINDSDDKDALDHFFGDLYDDGTEIDPKVKCGKGYSFRFTAKTIANTIEDDETLTKDSNTSSSALANINTPACTTQGG